MVNLIKIILKFFAFMFFQRKRRKSRARSIQRTTAYSPKSIQLSHANLWALAAGGVLTENSGESFNRLASRYSPQISRTCLADWWGVTDRESLLTKMCWLNNEGHRSELSRVISEVEQILKGMTHGDEIHLSKHGEFITNNIHLLKRLKFVAWDYSRLINVARWGYASGYITEDEAWQWIKKAAWVMSCEYTSWKDIGDDFILGYRYWSLNAVVIPSVLEAYERLINRPSSPWASIPWNIDPDKLQPRYTEHRTDAVES